MFNNKPAKLPTMADVLEVYRTQATVCEQIAERESAKIAELKAKLETATTEQKTAKNFGGFITDFLHKLDQ